MPHAPLLCRLSLLSAVATCSLALSVRAVAGEPAPHSKQIVEVRLLIVEISKTKLRNLGFDWEAMNTKRDGQEPSANMSSEQFWSRLEALDKNGIAHTLAKPMIGTRSGQKASIEMSPHLKVELTPTVAADEHVDLAYHIDIANARGPEGRFVTAHATELKSGIPQLLSETTSHHRTVKGEPNNSTILVLAQATIVK